MDLDYIQKYSFTENGNGGIPLSGGDSSILTTSLASQMGGGTSDFHLVIPGGLIYFPFEYSGKNTGTETDPWKINVKEDFEILLDLVSVREEKSVNKTIKKREKSNRNTKSLLKN